ncbi:hypothetical protein ACFLUV_00935 [Elusimicrobiota bacterium]
MKRCAICVLPEKFPGIKFDDQGKCNYCAAFKGPEKMEEEKKSYYEKFLKLIKGISNSGKYDCTLSYSGGKDSSYTLYVLKEIYNLRVLALVMDNGFMSEKALENADTVTSKLGIDCRVVKPDFNILKKIFSYAAENPMYSSKTLERASTICTSCIGLVKSIFLKIAVEENIPLMAWGWSPGQAPLRSSIMKINPSLFRSMQKALKDPMKDVAGDSIDQYFLDDSCFEDTESFPYSVSPLAFMEYSEKKIYDKLEELGWMTPGDVDGNSTNCLLNSYANQVHIKKYGFHPYVFEIASMVRMGIMSREKGIIKLEDTGDEKVIELVKNKLDEGKQ